MSKDLVCDGDQTTTGGRVFALVATMFDNNRRIALHGEEASCPECKGMFKIFGTGTDISEGGRATVLDGDLVLCPCGNNRVMAASNAGCSGEMSNNAAVAMNALSVDSVEFKSRMGGIYDEQVRIVDEHGQPIRNSPYYIKDSSGRVYQGVSNEQGLCPRVFTHGRESIYIAVGLAALEKWS